MIGAVRLLWACRDSPGYRLKGDVCCIVPEVREPRTPLAVGPIPRSRCRLIAIELCDALVLLYGETVVPLM